MLFIHRGPPQSVFDPYMSKSACYQSKHTKRNQSEVPQARHSNMFKAEATRSRTKDPKTHSPAPREPTQDKTPSSKFLPTYTGKPNTYKYKI